MSAKAILDGLIILNESALAIEQINNILVDMRSGKVPTEEEIEELVENNLNFIDAERERLGI